MKINLKLNHYHLILKDPSGYVLLETDIMFTKQAELKRTCKQWATIKNAHELEIWRGTSYQHYVKRVLDSEQHFCWEKRGPILRSGLHFKY